MSGGPLVIRGTGGRPVPFWTRAALRVRGWIMQRLAGGYSAASTGRRASGWAISNQDGDADSQIRNSLLLMRARARDLSRNNAHAKRILTQIVANMVGEGIRPRSAIAPRDSSDAAREEAEARNQAVDRLFAAWQRKAHDEGVLDFGGLQTLCARAWLESGEVLVRRRIRRREDGLPVPLQLQVLEADYLDETKDEALSDGRVYSQGVEIGSVGRRLAYWIRRVHPGAQYAFGATANTDSVRTPASEIVHLYLPERPGQSRGVPWLAPVMQALRDIDDYQSAERYRKKLEACLMAFVHGGDTYGPAPGTGDEGVDWPVVDANGDLVETWEPGLVVQLRGGKEVTVHQPVATSGYAEWMRTNLRGVSAGSGVPYEMLAADLSGTNYSSIRAGLVEFRRLITQLRQQILIPQLCDRVWEWWVDAAIASGALPPGEYPVQWSAPRYESVDRVKDAKADLDEIRAGVRSWREVVASRGEDPDLVIEEIAASNAAFDRHGIVLESDPRRDAQRGQPQPPGDGDDSGLTDDDDAASIGEQEA